LKNPQIIKIAILLPTLNVGGAERLVLEELSYLKNDPRFSFELHLVFEKGPLFEKFAETGLPVHFWGAPHELLQALKISFQISKYLRQRNFDILHCHLYDHIAPFIGKLAGTKVISTVHNVVAFGFFTRLGLRFCDLVLGCGNQVVNRSLTFMPKNKVGLLCNAVSQRTTHSISNAFAHDRLSRNSTSKIVLSLGRLNRQKGYDILINAFKQVAEHVPEAVLCIGGEGEQRQRLNEQIAFNNLQEKVKLIGHVENVDELLSICDVYVNSSRWEGLPITLLEAMAHRRAIVATDVGGNSEVIRHERTGLLVPPGDAEKLGRALITVLSNSELKDRLGTEAYKLFQLEYSIEKHCEELCGYYFKALDLQGESNDPEP